MGIENHGETQENVLYITHHGGAGRVKGTQGFVGEEKGGGGGR